MNLKYLESGERDFLPRIGDTDLFLSFGEIFLLLPRTCSGDDVLLSGDIIAFLCFLDAFIGGGDSDACLGGDTCKQIKQILP